MDEKAFPDVPSMPGVPQGGDKLKKAARTVAVIAAIAALAAGLTYFFYKSGKETTVEDENRPFTPEEKRNILESLKAPSEEELPIDERMRILESLSLPPVPPNGSKTTPIPQISDEEKQKILESLMGR